ncbi:ABC transporter substrate-binding protein [Marinicrinis lubricantis]|uniref:ABC transporter substrate-binding protein n=1 Tax=Marinicrinis lubricantis TaxID=2086470 RepID=A0ABW1IUJ4_9BACL
MKRWFTAALAVLFCVSIFLTACSNSKEDQTQKIRIGEVTRSLFYAPQYVAIEKGFFEEEGLNIELTTTFGGDKTMTALLTGSIDVALVGSETSIYVYLQEAEDPVINFAQLTQTDGTFLVSREPIENFSWDMLKGSTFLGQRKGGMPQMAGEFTLKKNGIDPHSDLELIQNVEFANIPSAFASGTGDFVQLFEPQATIFEQENRGHIVASFGTESGHLPYTVFMTKQSMIEDDPEVVQKFTNAVYKAQQWIQEHEVEEITELVMPYFEDADQDTVTAVIQRYKEQGSFATDPTIDEEEWNNLQDIMEEAGELPERVEHGTLVNNSFAEEAMK